MKNRKVILISMVAVLFLLLFNLNKVEAKDTEFEFYYQNIEKVVQINNPAPNGWWEKTKSLVKSGYNAVLKTWDSAVGRKYFPGEGTKRWYSSEDSSTAYDVRRTKVQSEKHLLSLMGASSEADLNDGQKAMLAVYRHSRSQAISDRSKYGYLSKVKVILSDTTGYEDSQKFPNVQRDFWPYSNGSLIQISSGRYNYPGSDDDSRSTFVHEYAHSMDRTIKEIIKPYGKDGSHYCNELTKPRSAFVEGWAEFNEMLDSEDEVSAMKRSITKVRLEDKSVGGKYTQVSVDDKSLSGMDLMSVEGINAMILYRIATEIPNGREKIFDTFSGTGWKLLRSLKTFTSDLAKRYPGDLQKIAEIVDTESKNRLSDSELSKFIGNSAGAKAYVTTRGKTEEVEAGDVAGAGQVARAPEASVLLDKIQRLSAQDFAAELSKAHKALVDAHKAYVTAITNGSQAEEAIEIQKDYLAKKQTFEELKRSRKKNR